MSAQRGALSHNGIIEGEVRHYFQKAIRATESYHLEMLKRLGNGEDAKEIALEKARWVNTLTDIQTFAIMNFLAKLMLKRSQSEAEKENLFTIP